jgi:FKBP-type peptidyl-prolyl cis-trans isomerase FklB
LKGDNIDLDEEAFMAAIRDMAAGKQPRLSKSEIQAVLQKVQQQRAAEAQKTADENLRKGQEFLSANGKKAGVKTLPSGLQYKVIRAGTGKSPKATDTVKVDYRGTLINGTEFDSSYKRGQPATFPVNGVIKGWQEALQLMKEGAKWQIYVPAELAYGPRGAGGQIGPNETLIFDVELLQIKGQ